MATQAQPAANPNSDEIVQRRLDEATFRAERLARQRMDEARQRAAVEAQRWREVEELQMLGATKAAPTAKLLTVNEQGEASEEEDSDNEADEEFQDAEDQEEEDEDDDEEDEEEEDEEEEEQADRRERMVETGRIATSPSSGSSSAESAESSRAEMAPEPGVETLPVNADSVRLRPEAPAEQQPPNNGQDEDSDGPPPGNWSEASTANMPFPPLPPSQSAELQALPIPPSDAEPLGGGALCHDDMLAYSLVPGSVVIELLGAKRRKVAQDASVTLKELMHACPEFAVGGGRRRLCIADCVSKETLQKSRNCPLLDRPILRLSMD